MLGLRETRVDLQYSKNILASRQFTFFSYRKLNIPSYEVPIKMLLQKNLSVIWFPSQSLLQGMPDVFMLTFLLFHIGAVPH